MTIKCIIFDLGDVIVNLDFSRFFNEVITPSPLNKPKTPIILEFFRQSDTYHQGKVTNEEFYTQACELLQICNLNQNEFFDAFNSIIAGLDLRVVEVIKKIRQFNKLKIMCLSNINASHWKYLKSQKWDIWDLFDEFILSHEIKLTKPDYKIFKYAIERAGCRPREILFIDDGLNNIRAARDVNIIAIRYIGLDNLIEELIKYNIKLS
ncbi:MAG: HAD family phosphatase [Candidatus Lokiarchaeota archaeon]|nr:HAD family phosphatase [Candidatus Lokiarchaeota archaeon]